MTFTPLDSRSFKFQPPTDPRVRAGLVRLGLASGSRGYNAHSHIGLNNFKRFKTFYSDVFTPAFADRLTAPRVASGDTFAPDLWRFALLIARANVPVTAAVPYLAELHDVEWDVLTDSGSVIEFHYIVTEGIPVEYLCSALTAGLKLGSSLTVLNGWRRDIPVDYLTVSAGGDGA